MSKINREIAAFIVFLIIVILWGLFIKAPTDTKASVDTEVSVDVHNPFRELRAGGLLIEFENGAAEPEVKSVIENCNLTRNCILEYDVDHMGDRYYVKVDENKRDELRKEDKWNDPIFPEIKKGNHYYIIVSEEGFEDESFLKVMEKHDLQVKKSIVCYVLFGDGSMNWNEPKNWIPERDAIRIKNELEMNEKVLIVSPDYIEG